MSAEQNIRKPGLSIEITKSYLNKFRLEAGKVSGLCFFVYIYFIIDYFLRFSSRFSWYGAARPTLISVLLISLLLVLQSEKLKGKANNTIWKSFIFLIAYIFISLPLVEWPGSVIKLNMQIFIKGAVFFVFTIFIVDTEKRLKILIFSFLSCQIFRVFEPLYLNITQGYWGDNTYWGKGEFVNRLAGAPADVINPNELGFVIVTIIPYLHYFLWQGSRFSKLLYLILIPILAYALILTMSRGAFLALVVVIVIIFKESNHKIIMIVILFIALVCTWGGMSNVHQERYRSILGGEGKQAATAEGRIDGIIEEFKLGFSKPLAGYGLGTTPEAKANLIGRRQASHNLYAELLIELGVLGFVIFITFIINVKSNIKNNFWLSKRVEAPRFYISLNKSLFAVFWMYVVYSFNYWGLSQYYWYFLGGITLVLNKRLLDMMEAPGQ